MLPARDDSPTASRSFLARAESIEANSLGITRMRRKLTIIAVVLAVVYTTGYGVARWRKFVVMREYHLKGEGVVMRETGPGLDVRQDWRGRLKNRANPVVFFCFRPLCAVEDFFRGGRRSIR
jgi:hypothetical protein